MGANLEQVARIHFQEPESDFRFTEVLEPLDSFQRAECPCRLDPVPLPSSFPSNIRAGLLYIYFTVFPIKLQAIHYRQNEIVLLIVLLIIIPAEISGKSFLFYKVFFSWIKLRSL